MAETLTTRVGDIEVIAVTDGATEFTPGMFLNTSEDEISEILEAAGESEIRTNFNAFFLRGPQGITMVDSGRGHLAGPGGSNLEAAMAELGIAPGDVTRLVFTHLHPDHIGGAITAEGAAVFPDAEVTFSELEQAFWSDGSAYSGQEPMESWFKVAGSMLAAYKDRIVTFAGTDGAEVAPGITAIPLHGHTPGHTGFRVSDGDDQLVLAADIAHAQILQFANPEICVGFDIDPEAAGKARKRALDMLATDGIRFSGGHILGPDKFVTVARSGIGYKTL
ncbi:MBL fold metallo-hydrolase [Mesobacterium pallidum]|uniref:MBL fold metallo-hydrolase n=1 Tax=Mesobacterium pallidum TaxID=2872037 RepID=UPI001EE17A60|nr:MBL fold metallo-hydrolase [Mesobacterium pallidum]